MARPIKYGLDYFPQDTDIHSDRKIARLRTKHGGNGYMIYDYIKCLCYKEGGYYADFDENTCFDISLALGAGITEDLVNDVIETCFSINLFDRAMFNKQRILTSNGIQKRYLKAKRDATIENKFSLLNAEIEVIAEEKPVIAAETPIIAAGTNENDAESTQTKLNQNKENKTKEESKQNRLREFELFWDLYDKKVETDKCKTKFLKLPEKDVIKIFETIKDYVNAHPEKQYRKNPSTYLNNKCWNDEIVKPPQPTPQTPYPRPNQQQPFPFDQERGRTYNH